MFNQQFQAPIPSNFQGFMPNFGTPSQAFPSGMSGYGSNPTGFGTQPPNFGVLFAGFNPSQHWNNPLSQQRQTGLQITQPSAMLTNTPSISGSSSASTAWFPDSGASFHVTGDARNIQDSLSYDGPEQIFIGNGQGLDIHSSGSSVFTSPVKPQITLTLNKLLHVPTITRNLISVSQFAKDNFVFFEFHVIIVLLNLRPLKRCFCMVKLVQMVFILFLVSLFSLLSFHCLYILIMHLFAL